MYEQHLKGEISSSASPESPTQAIDYVADGSDPYCTRESTMWRLMRRWQVWSLAGVALGAVVLALWYY